jgi:hypothetical protein
MLLLYYYPVACFVWVIIGKTFPANEEKQCLNENKPLSNYKKRDFP